MAWHTTTNHPEIDLDSRSLVVAFANLLKKFEIDQDPVQLYALMTQDSSQLDLSALVDHVADVELDESGTASWPTTNDAIIRFRRIDPEVGGVVDHYCLAADPAAHSVIDSLDGYIRNAAAYGEPLDWVSFSKRVTAPAPARPAPEPTVPKPGTTYTWVKYDNIWDVARRLDFRPLELLEHNDITDWRAIQPGTVLHLPQARIIAADPRVDIEVLPTLHIMHVAKSGGTRKWSFGRVLSRGDIRQTGPIVPEQKNVTIVAIAHVPVAGETVDYYMDTVAFGNYPTTGRVAYTIGFDPADLAEGNASKPKRQQQPLPPVMAATMDRIAAGVEALKEQPPTPSHPPTMADVMHGSSTGPIKATIHPLAADRHVKRFYFIATMLVHELDGRRVPKQVYQHDAVDVRLGVWIDNKEWYLPLDHEETGLFYLLDPDLLMDKEKLYDTHVELADRIAGHTFSLADRTLWIPLAWTKARYFRFKSIFIRNSMKEQP